MSFALRGKNIFQLPPRVALAVSVPRGGKAASLSENKGSSVQDGGKDRFVSAKKNVAKDSSFSTALTLWKPSQESHVDDIDFFYFNTCRGENERLLRKQALFLNELVQVSTRRLVVNTFEGVALGAALGLICCSLAVGTLSFAPVGWALGAVIGALAGGGLSIEGSNENARRLIEVRGVLDVFDFFNRYFTDKLTPNELTDTITDLQLRPENKIRSIICAFLEAERILLFDEDPAIMDAMRNYYAKSLDIRLGLIPESSNYPSAQIMKGKRVIAGSHQE